MGIKNTIDNRGFTTEGNRDGMPTVMCIPSLGALSGSQLIVDSVGRLGAQDPKGAIVRGRIDLVAARSFTSSSTNVTGWTELLDTENIFDHASGTFTPTLTGYYMIGFNIPVNILTNGTDLYGGLQGSHANYYITNDYASYGTGSVPHPSVVLVTQVTAGDTVYPWLYASKDVQISEFETGDFWVVRV